MTVKVNAAVLASVGRAVRFAAVFFGRGFARAIIIVTGHAFRICIGVTGTCAVVI